MADAFAEAVASHLKVVEAMRGSLPVLRRMAGTIVTTFRAGGRLYIFGNGGSAADAQHIAAEFVGRFKLDRQALPAIALTTDTSALTAITNDMGGEHIFVRQVRALVTDRDIVWALSVSGTSPNVIGAMTEARRRGATLFGFTGKSGDALADLCHECFRADHTSSDRVQEAHELAYHMICEHVEAQMA